MAKPGKFIAGIINYQSGNNKDNADNNKDFPNLFHIAVSIEINFNIQI